MEDREWCYQQKHDDRCTRSPSEAEACHQVPGHRERSRQPHGAKHSGCSDLALEETNGCKEAGADPCCHVVRRKLRCSRVETILLKIVGVVGGQPASWPDITGGIDAPTRCLGKGLLSDAVVLDRNVEVPRSDDIVDVLQFVDRRQRLVAPHVESHKQQRRDEQQSADLPIDACPDWRRR